MSFIAKMFGMTPEKQAAMMNDKIKEHIEDTCEQMNVPFNELFWTLQPINEKFEFKIHLYHKQEGKAPVHVREISVMELIIGEDENDE